MRQEDSKLGDYGGHEDMRPGITRPAETRPTDNAT
jgi:hypothetical protein